MPQQVFISHRHADQAIANVIRENLLMWGLPQGAIFQSSMPQHGPRIGQPLTDSLSEALQKAQLVLLPYTFSDQDWSYVMWEAGVASAPTKQGGTTIVVFQCSDDAPAPFHDRVRVAITPDQIQKFTTQFHKEEGFFPGQPAFAPEIAEAALRTRSQQFYEALERVVPHDRGREMPRWDFLTLELHPEAVQQAKDAESDESARNIIESNLLVIRGFGEASTHFGFAQFVPNGLSAYLDRWRQSTDDAPEDWIGGMCAEIWRAIRNMASETTWDYLRSARPPGVTWFYPVINHGRIMPDRRMEFELYLYKAPVVGPQ